MAKVTVFESFEGKVKPVEMEYVDAREAVQHDPERWSWNKPGSKKGEGSDGAAQPRFKAEHTGQRKYNVVDTANGEIIETGWDKDAADAKAAALNG